MVVTVVLKIHQRVVILQFDMWETLPSDLEFWQNIKNDIKKYGMRNSLITALMPTAVLVILWVILSALNRIQIIFTLEDFSRRFCYY